MALEFIFAVGFFKKISSEIYKIESGIRQSRKNIRQWCIDLDKVKQFRLVLDNEKFVFYSDDEVKGYSWLAFEKYWINDTFICLYERNNNSIFFAKASVNTENFKKIKEIVIDKIPLGSIR